MKEKCALINSCRIGGPLSGWRAAFAVLVAAMLSFGGIGLPMNGLIQPASAQEAGPNSSGEVARTEILVVNTREVLETSETARLVKQKELDARERVQAILDGIKEDLEASERELTALRTTLSSEEFKRRGESFDVRVRRERRVAQARGAQLTRYAQDNRDRMTAVMPQVLEQLRRKYGAYVILEASSVLAATDGLDKTAEAITIFDELLSKEQFEPPAALFR